MNLLKKTYYKVSGKQEVFINDNKYEIAKHLPKNPIILEAGACDGRDTLQMASFWGKAEIHAFEPIEDLYQTALEKTGHLKRVHLYKQGLANQTGKTKLYVSGGKSTGSSSILKPQEHLNFHPDVIFEKEIEIEVSTIDDWATKYQVSKIDFMWLDLQGAEMAILQTSPKILATTKVIFTEVSLKKIYENAPLYPELSAWLGTQGFEVAWEDLPYEDMGNVLFVRK